MSQQHLSPEQQPSSQRQIPSIEAIGPVVDEVIDIARRELDVPRSVEIETWEDREFEVRVNHWYPAGSENRYGYDAVIHYHSDRETIRGVLFEEDTEADEREALLKMDWGHISDPVPEKNGE